MRDVPVILDALVVVLAQDLVDAPVEHFDDLGQVVGVPGLPPLTLRLHAVHHRVDHVHVLVELLLGALDDADQLHVLLHDARHLCHVICNYRDTVLYRLY